MSLLPHQQISNLTRSRRISFSIKCKLARNRAVGQQWDNRFQSTG